MNRNRHLPQVNAVLSPLQSQDKKGPFTNPNVKCNKNGLSTRGLGVRGLLGCYGLKTLKGNRISGGRTDDGAYGH